MNNEMNDRAALILEATVQEFIDTGEPVSSGWLYKQYDFGIKPAMIRLELDALEDHGYLEQPYHSAGRVPTDSGYEFFVEKVLRSAVDRSIRSDALRELFERRALSNLAEELSSQLGLLSIAADLVREEVYKTGLEALINNLDWESRDEIRSVIHDFEAV